MDITHDDFCECGREGWVCQEERAAEAAERGGVE